MTIKLERSFYGLHRTRTTLCPGTTIWVEYGKRNPGPFAALNAVIVDSNTLRVTRYKKTHLDQQDHKEKERLRKDRINQNPITFPIFPGINEKLVWEPTR